MFGCVARSSLATMAKALLLASLSLMIWALPGRAEGPILPADAADATRGQLETIADKYFTAEQIETGRRRAGGSRIFYGIGLLLKFGLLIALCTARLGGRMLSLCERMAGASRRRLARWLYLALLWFAIEAAMMPYRLARLAYSRAWGEIYGYGQYLVDWLIGWAIMAGIPVPVPALIHLLRRRTRWWPAILWAGGVVLAAAIAFAHPYIYDPLFYKFWPVTETNVIERAEKVSRAAGTNVDKLFWIDASRRTIHGNAYFVGWGGSRRIVLYDTIARYDIDTLESLLAHETGHWRRDHVVKGMLWGALGGLVFVVLLAAALKAQPRFPIIGHARESPHVLDSAFILLAVWIAMVAPMPVENAISRGFEAQADQESLELTMNPAAFIRLEVMLTLQNKGEVLAPGWAEWALHSHPTTARRIAAAEIFAREHGIALPPLREILDPRPPAVAPGKPFPPLPEDFPLIRAESQP